MNNLIDPRSEQGRGRGSGQSRGSQALGRPRFGKLKLFHNIF